MVTASHHWLKAVELFPLKDSGKLFIFNPAMLPLSGRTGWSCRARSSPSATSRTRSCVVIVGVGFLGGEGEQGCRKGGQDGSDGEPKGGPADDPGGVEGENPPCPAVDLGAGRFGDMWRRSCSSRCLISSLVGSSGGLCRRSVGPGFRCSRLPNAGGE